MDILDQLWELLLCLLEMLLVEFYYLLAFLQLLPHHSHSLFNILLYFLAGLLQRYDFVRLVQTRHIKTTYT